VKLEQLTGLSSKVNLSTSAGTLRARGRLPHAPTPSLPGSLPTRSSWEAE